MFDYLTGNPLLENTWLYAILTGIAIGAVLGAALNLVVSTFESRGEVQDQGDLDAQGASDVELVEPVFYKARDKALEAQQSEAKTG